MSDVPVKIKWLKYWWKDAATCCLKFEWLGRLKQADWKGLDHERDIALWNDWLGFQRTDLIDSAMMTDSSIWNSLSWLRFECASISVKCLEVIEDWLLVNSDWEKHDKGRDRWLIIWKLVWLRLMIAWSQWSRFTMIGMFWKSSSYTRSFASRSWNSYWQFLVCCDFAIVCLDVDGLVVGQTGVLEWVQVGQVSWLSWERDTITLHQERVVLANKLPDQILRHSWYRELVKTTQQDTNKIRQWLDLWSTSKSVKWPIIA